MVAVDSIDLSSHWKPRETAPPQVEKQDGTEVLDGTADNARP